MADRPPPSRYAIVERGGRLVVLDRDTGRTPPTAAERMAEHDRRMGNEPIRPAARAVPEAPAPAKIPEAPPPPARPTADRAVAARANRKQPWTNRDARPAAPPAPARAARPAAVAASGRKTIVTGKWWDAKGPRTIALGPRGRQTLSSGFTTLALVLLVVAIAALFIAPLVAFAGAFLLFRFGGQILGPIGAGVVDRAVAARD